MTALEGKALLDHGHAIARRYAGRIGSDVADDLRAEAMLRALRSPPPDGRMEPWLERIYRNLLVDRWRRASTASVSEMDLARPIETDTPEDALLSRECRHLVRKHLIRLPKESRRILLSRYFAEAGDAESAERLRIAPATVRTRVHRALARLRERMGDLRTVFPPILGKLFAEASAVALAPVLAVVLVAGPTVTPKSLLPAQVGTPVAATRIASLSPSTTLTRADPRPMPTSVSRPRVRTFAKASMQTVVSSTTLADSSASPTLPIDRIGRSIGNIEQPDVVDIFVEPQRPVGPSLIVPPENFAVQLEKMIEEML